MGVRWMSHFRDKLKQNGYDAEEAYFYKKEQELIQKMREQNQKGREHLKLIKGGLSETLPRLPAGQSSKKAA